ncbi:FabD/lysophospholipase-like protein [Zopfia rhizophila CBS 207.26]|uniref:FabD/lysophospholipase-like protein n=1 Tax=Zopfia rhizophila CBS 207.26 TaxID=1314779 RepID=A0A6A6E7I0_9PEZI|nr:FabD/lysophospholipase-like protein [Zopfia rhizophila CBS 207.26]
MLARMEMDIEKAIGQYDDVGKKVFAKPRLLHSIKGGNALVPKYPTSNVENALRDVIKVGLQAELRLRDTTADKVPFESNPARSRTITVAHGPTTENNTVFRTYLFRSYDHPYPSPLSTLSYNEKHRNPGRAHQEPIWKIARATSAVPLYFRPISFGDHEYRDGGIGNKNPSSLALKEVLQMHEQRPRLLISIGTGTVEPPEPKAKGKVSTSIISHIKDSLQTIRLLTEWATESEKTHNEVEEYIDVMDQDKVQYYRFNTDMGKNKILLDEWKLKKDGSNETKDSLLNLTLAYLKQSDIHESLLRCARILAMVRRQRARTDRWELFAREFVYYCPEDRCKKVARTFETREDLRQHSYDAHGFVWEVDICNDTGLKHACFWDQCQHGSIHVYRTRDEYLKHLKDNHNIVQGPRFKTRSELEEWLDMGRKGPREAVEFIKNHRQKTMTTKSPPPKKGKNMASGVSLNSQLNGSSSP